MKRIIHITTTFLFILTLASCVQEDFWKEGEYYHLEHKGAILPIWIKGNIESGIFVFTVHGGPTSSSGHEFALSDGFKALEEITQ